MEAANRSLKIISGAELPAVALIVTAKTIADTVVAIIGNKTGIDLKRMIQSGSCSTKNIQEKKLILSKVTKVSYWT